MVVSSVQILTEVSLSHTTRIFRQVERTRVILSLIAVLLLLGTASAQDPTAVNTNQQTVVVSGINNSTVFGLGKSVKITGTVKQGAVAFGGDVIVEGVVEGDVAAIGGSVFQSDAGRIGGDVIVLGGTYQHGEK